VNWLIILIGINREGGLLPYDWITYGHPLIFKLLDLLKIDSDGSIKSKDKKGCWRVMKEIKKLSKKDRGC